MEKRKGVQITFSNRTLYNVLFVIILILSGTAVYAYNSGGPASYVGHTADEIEGVCLSDGTNCLAVSNGIGTLENGKWCTSDGTLVNCQSDAPVAGGSTESYYGTPQMTNIVLNFGNWGNDAFEIETLGSTSFAFIDGLNDLLKFYRLNLEGDTPTWTQVGSSLDLSSTDPSAGGETTTQWTMAALSPTDIALTNSDYDTLETYHWSGSSWSKLGSTLTISGGSSLAGLAALSSTDVAHIDLGNQELRTYHWDGTDWSQVGSGLNLGSMGYSRLTALSSTDIALVHQIQPSTANGELRTYHWSGSFWSQVGNSFVIEGGWSSKDITALSSTDIAFIDSNNDDLRIYHWDGTDWFQRGSDFHTMYLAMYKISALSSTDILLIDGTKQDLRTYHWGADSKKPHMPPF